MRSRVLPLGLLALAVGGPASGADVPLAPLDAVVERARREFEIPGVGLALVKGSRVVLARGYGRRRLGGTEAVDAGTLFAIASNTKLFTAAALGLLAEDGRLSWDDAVSRHLPYFQMYDPYVSREMTVRDLLTHRSGLGLGEGDLLYFPPSTFTRREIVEKIRALKPATSFRSRYAYDNILYIAAGEVVAAASGATWESVVHDRLLAPLGMNDSVPVPSALRPGANLATPHAPVDGTVRAVAADDADNIAPAGGILSSARDMGAWVSALLDAGAGPAAGTSPGVVPRARVVPPRLVEALFQAETVMPITPLPAALSALAPRFQAYGLGVNVRDYHGRKLITHTGGLSGMVSRVALVPEEGLGVVVLTNQESGGGRDAIAFTALDLLLGLPATDWVAAFKEATREAEHHARDVVAGQAAARAASSPPSLPLARYAGAYRDAWYGDVAIEVAEAHLVLRFSRSPALLADLEHWQYDTFVAHWRDHKVPDAFVTFALRPDGSIDQVKMVAVSPAADFSYDYQDLLLVPVRPN